MVVTHKIKSPHPKKNHSILSGLSFAFFPLLIKLVPFEMRLDKVAEKSMASGEQLKIRNQTIHKMVKIRLTSCTFQFLEALFYLK